MLCKLFLFSKLYKMNKEEILNYIEWICRENGYMLYRIYKEKGDIIKVDIKQKYKNLPRIEYSQKDGKARYNLSGEMSSEGLVKANNVIGKLLKINLSYILD